MDYLKYILVCFIWGHICAAKKKPKARSLPAQVDRCQVTGFPWYWDDIKGNCCTCTVCPRPVVLGGFMEYNSGCAAFYRTIPKNNIVRLCPTSTSNNCRSLEDVQSGKFDLLYFDAGSRKTAPKKTAPKRNPRNRKKGGARKEKNNAKPMNTIKVVQITTAAASTPLPSTAEEFPIKSEQNQTVPIWAIALFVLAGILFASVLLICCKHRQADKTNAKKWCCKKKTSDLEAERQPVPGQSRASLEMSDSVIEEPSEPQSPPTFRAQLNGAIPERTSGNPNNSDRTRREDRIITTETSSKITNIVTGDHVKVINNYYPSTSSPPVQPARPPEPPTEHCEILNPAESFAFPTDTIPFNQKLPERPRATNDDDTIPSKPVQPSKNTHPGTSFRDEIIQQGGGRSYKGYAPRPTPGPGSSLGSSFDFQNSRETTVKEPVSANVMEGEPLLHRSCEGVSSLSSREYTTAIQESCVDALSDLPLNDGQLPSNDES